MCKLTTGYSLMQYCLASLSVMASTFLKKEPPKKQLLCETCNYFCSPGSALSAAAGFGSSRFRSLAVMPPPPVENSILNSA